LQKFWEEEVLEGVWKYDGQQTGSSNLKIFEGYVESEWWMYLKFERFLSPDES
jgi:hypothetical protein